MHTRIKGEKMSASGRSARYERANLWDLLPKVPVTSASDLVLRHIDRSLFVVLIVSLILGALLSIFAVHLLHDEPTKGATSWRQN